MGKGGETAKLRRARLLTIKPRIKLRKAKREIKPDKWTLYNAQRGRPGRAATCRDGTAARQSVSLKRPLYRRRKKKFMIIELCAPGRGRGRRGGGGKPCQRPFSEEYCKQHGMARGRGIISSSLSWSNERERQTESGAAGWMKVIPLLSADLD